MAALNNALFLCSGSFAPASKTLGLVPQLLHTVGSNNDTALRVYMEIEGNDTI